MKQQNGSRPRPVWVDNWLIRERVARWRTRDKVKDWVRRVPRRVALLVCNIYVAIAVVVFGLLIWRALRHTQMTLIRRREVGIMTPLLPRVLTPHKDGEALERLQVDIRSDSVRRKTFEEYLRLHPAMADSLKALQRLYPGLRY